MTDNRTTEQTAMERFRAALEKRGVEFETDDDECAEGEERVTVFKANLGESDSDIYVTAKDWYFDGKLTPWLDVEFHNTLTPEQAIAATLGSGTCEFMPFADEDWSEPNAVRGVCSECSALMYGKDNYCPNCGARVRKKVDE